MTDFQAGDKVVHRREKDLRNYGTVMDIPPGQQKPGWIAVYFARKVWCKPENLDLLSKRIMASPKPAQAITESIKDYWTSQH